MAFAVALLLCLTAPVQAAGGDRLLRAGEADRIVRALGLADLTDLTTYRFDLAVSDLTGTYEGSGSITWTNTTGRPQPELPLLLYPNAVGTTGDGGTLEVRELVVESGPAAARVRRGTTEVTVEFESAVTPGQRVVFRVDFGGRLRRLSAASNDLFAQAMGGLGSMTSPVGVADYGLLGEGDGLLTIASAYPMVAPVEDGAFVRARASRVGDLAWNQVAAFDLRIATPTGLQVVTNLVDGAPEAVGAQTQVTSAAGVGVRDLVISASRSFTRVEKRVGDITVRSWSLDRDAAAGAVALEDALAALQLLGNRVAPYPYRELDVVEATLTGGAGGVEFSGLVLVAGFLYRDPSQSANPFALLSQMYGGGAGGSVPNPMADILRGQRRFVVVHEVAHQWVPGLLGTDSQSSPVVDEALAQYLAGRVVEAQVGREQGRTERDRNVGLNYALYRLMGGPDGPADRPTDAFGSSLEYGALVYGKAPYLYVDLEDRLGRDRLDGALRRAVAGNAWKTVDTAGWIAALEKGGATGVGALADRWWRGVGGDEDLGYDPSGRAAFALIVGEELATQMEQSFRMIGLDFGTLLRMMGGGLPTAIPYQPGTPSPDQMLRMLREHHP